VRYRGNKKGKGQDEKRRNHDGLRCFKKGRTFQSLGENHVEGEEGDLLSCERKAKGGKTGSGRGLTEQTQTTDCNRPLGEKRPTLNSIPQIQGKERKGQTDGDSRGDRVAPVSTKEIPIPLDEKTQLEKSRTLTKRVSLGRRIAKRDKSPFHQIPSQRLKKRTRGSRETWHQRG